MKRNRIHIFCLIPFLILSINSCSNNVEISAIDLFYKANIKESKLDDDCSFCGFYETRYITKDSVTLFKKYELKNNRYIFQFAINGFYECSDDILSPYFWNNGELMKLETAKENGLISSDEINNIVITYELDENITKDFYNLDYINKLPLMKNKGPNNKSRYIKPFENIRTDFYTQIILENKLKTTEDFFGLFNSEYTSKNPKMDILFDSVYLKNSYDLNNDVILFQVGINDAYTEAHFGVAANHKVNSDYTLQTNDYLLPFIWKDGLVKTLDDAFSSGWYSVDQLVNRTFIGNIENKLLERKLYWENDFQNL